MDPWITVAHTENIKGEIFTDIEIITQGLNFKSSEVDS